MNNQRPSTTLSMTAALAVGLTFCLSGGAPLAAQTASVYQSGLFELGDGIDPAVPGIADIVGLAGQPGPDWSDLFGADGGWKDVYDELGNAGSNGVPDFLDGYGALRGRSDAGFIGDSVSAGTGVDATVFTGSGQLGPGTVDPGYDLANVYAYTGFNPGRDLVLYLGIERLTNAGGSIVFELNKNLFSIDPGGAIVGSRSVGDLEVTAEFSAGILSSVMIRSWEGGWAVIDTLPIDPAQPSEQCNAGETLCVVCNGASVAGGDWTSYDAAGNPIANLLPDTFMELGINLSALLGVHTWQSYYDTRYANIQVSTYDDAVPPAARDYALGSFIRASRLAQ